MERRPREAGSGTAEPPATLSAGVATVAVSAAPWVLNALSNQTLLTVVRVPWSIEALMDHAAPIWGASFGTMIVVP